MKRKKNNKKQKILQMQLQFSNCKNYLHFLIQAKDHILIPNFLKRFYLNLLNFLSHNRILRNSVEYFWSIFLKLLYFLRKNNLWESLAISKICFLEEEILCFADL